MIPPSVPLGVGITLHPDASYLAACAPLIEGGAGGGVDYLEVAPEALWHSRPDGSLDPSPWAEVMLRIKARSGKPFVGHGVGLSPGTAPGSKAERARLRRWLEQIAEDQSRFDFLWYTEHLGWVTAEGLTATLPLPLPPTDESVEVVCSRLNLLKPVLPSVGFENQVSYFHFGSARDEAPFWNRICRAGDLWLLLDLHNAWTQCVNDGIDLDEYLAPLELDRVLEIHLSGGSESEQGWLPGGRTLRLDTHDAPVPEPVWREFEQLRPRCPNLRGVTVERMAGTFASAADAAAYGEEVHRARDIFFGLPGRSNGGRPC